MSFLAPLFFLGALAVSLPILFHLIRRTPRGRVRFSSLMFLRASPPRITRRSRLDNWLLLILRATALSLLAIAFARPFLREAAHLHLADTGSRLAILVDTSASMRRGDLWPQAARKVNAVLDGAKPADEISLFTFDDRVIRLIGFEDASEIPPEQRSSFVRRRFASVRPTWGATDIGGALVTVADALDVSGDATSSDRRAPLDQALRIVLVTDLQRGSRLEALAAYDWPDRVQLTVERVVLPQASNAGLVLLADPDSSTATQPRVRVLNETPSRKDQFFLRWANAREDQVAAAATSVYVPPGESRVVPALSAGKDFLAEQLVLTGDDHDFDNTFYVAPLPRDEVTVLYVGAEAGDDAKDLRYYVERALAGSGRRQVRFISHPSDRPLPPDAKRPPRLVIVTTDPEVALQRSLSQYTREGGTLLCVVKSAQAVRSLGALLGYEDLSVEEVDEKDYAMLGEIDFSHPLFASFVDPRFSDFTKIRFWRHRRLTLGGGDDTGMRILARFDDGDPAVLEKTTGKGRILVLTSGWHPRDSQLALSTKFVPLLASLLESHPGDAEDRVSFYVNESVPVPAAAKKTTRRKVRKPDGTELDLAVTDVSFDDTDQPGIYELEIDGVEHHFAVNLSPAESKTAPFAVENLEQHGVQLGAHTKDMDRQRQMRDLELEKSQKLWKWLVLVALGVLILETWLAGRLALLVRGPG